VISHESPLFPGLGQSQERVEGPGTQYCRGEIFRLEGWRKGRCLRVSAEYQTEILCACQRISSSAPGRNDALPHLLIAQFVVSKCFKVDSKTFMRHSRDIIPPVY